MSSYLILQSHLIGLVDKTPKPADVKAGWVAFWIFVALAVAVALLGVSLTKHLRKTDANAEQGVFDPSDPKAYRRDTPPLA
ncbi:MAG: hypothetical protein JWR35_703 [Marmoricola sp.]|jgi:hypothetical protein|nr:hypothetical protein [Marmoricola sp.]